MKNNKVPATWPKIVILILSVICLIGALLPWVVYSGWGEPTTKNLFDGFFSPGQWVMPGCLGVIVLFNIIALAMGSRGSTILSGVLSILASLILIGNFALLGFGLSEIGARNTFSTQSFGVGFYISLTTSIVVFIFSMVSLRLKSVNR